MSLDDSETTRWFAEEVQPHEVSLRCYLHKIAASADIDDLVQEAYVRILRVQARSEVHSTRGLLFTLARNAAHDLIRRRAVALTSSIADIDVSPQASDGLGTAEIVSRQEEVDLLHAAIDALPERCRVVFVLRQFENLSHREIAARLGIAQHTVERQLTEALRRCGKFLAHSSGFRTKVLTSHCFRQRIYP